MHYANPKDKHTYNYYNLLYKIDYFIDVSAINKIDNLTYVRLFMIISHVSMH